MPEVGDEAAIENLDLVTAPDSELVAARQRAFMWDENKCLSIAPGQHKLPLNVIYDEHAEELSFPQIYYGVPRLYNMQHDPTPYTVAISEIRRRDRRGVTPDHILYMAMKIMRLRVSLGMKYSFRCIAQNENITRKNLEDRKFLEESVNKNFTFLKSIPNSVQYWV